MSSYTVGVPARRRIVRVSNPQNPPSLRLRPFPPSAPLPPPPRLRPHWSFLFRRPRGCGRFGFHEIDGAFRRNAYPPVFIGPLCDKSFLNNSNLGIIPFASRRRVSVRLRGSAARQTQRRNETAFNRLKTGETGKSPLSPSPPINALRLRQRSRRLRWRFASLRLLSFRFAARASGLPDLAAHAAATSPPLMRPSSAARSARGRAGLNRKPCAWVQPCARRKSSCSAVSTPSAVVAMPRLRASVEIAVMIAVQSAPLGEVFDERAVDLDLVERESRADSSAIE